MAELATIGAGYLGYALVRLAIHADRPAPFAHAAQPWQAQRRMHLRNEPWLTGLAAPRPALAEVSDRHLVQAIRRLARPGHPRAGSSI